MWDPANLKALCRECHKAEHPSWGKPVWIPPERHWLERLPGWGQFAVWFLFVFGPAIGIVTAWCVGNRTP